MKILLSSAAGLSLALLLLFGHHQLSRADVERALLNQMNGTSAGRITRDVRCGYAGVVGGATRYRCVLQGAAGSREQAVVFVSGGTWRAQWEPLAG